MRIVAMIVISTLLAACGILEEIYVGHVISTLKETSAELYTLVEEREDEDIQTEEIENKFETLKNFWEKQEQLLAYIVNYEKIKILDEVMTRFQSALLQNDYLVAHESIMLIKRYVEGLHFVMGSDAANIL